MIYLKKTNGSYSSIKSTSAFLMISLLTISFIFPSQARASIPLEFQAQTGPPFSLSSGWNEIIWSSSLVSQTAQTALADIDSDCGTGTGLVMAKKSSNFWQDYVAEYEGKNFALEADQTYFVRVSRFCDWDPPSGQLTPTPTPTPRPTVPPSPGREETITIIIDLADAQVSCPTEQVNDGMYGPTNSTAASYYESSRGEIDIFGETVRLQLPLTESQVVCDPDGRMALAGAVDEKLIQQGYNLGKYWRRFYVLPVCNGGNFLYGYYIFSSECQKPKLLAHELGHTMGRVGNRMYHASTPDWEYGDFSCVMGGVTPRDSTAPSWKDYPYVPQWNAPHRIALGWANYRNVTESGQYILIATERDDHVIWRVPKDSQQAYYLSLRAPIGEDTDLDGYLIDGYLNKVSIHTFLSDPLADGDQRSWLQATLEPGQSYSGEGMTVKCLEVDGATATVQVTLR